MLSVFLSEEFERLAKLSSDGVFLQYYCDNKDEKRNTAIAIVRGLIFQLLRAQPQLYDHILPSFKIQRQTLVTSFESLWRCFEAMVCSPDLGNVNCVLDGLDECDEASTEALLRKLNNLYSISPTTCRLHMIIVSRAYPEYIPRNLANHPRIQLDVADGEVDENMSSAATAVESDVNYYIATSIDRLAVSRHYSNALREHVQRSFRERAQGTFLWVGIATRILEKVDIIDVEHVLDSILPGLDQLYGRMLLQITPARRNIIARILRWVVMAIRPLSLLELVEALDIQATALFAREEVMRNHVLSCGYFLTIREGQVGLIHQSAKDYLLRQTCDTVHELERFRIDESNANLEIAQRCLGYLHDGALADGEVDLKHNTAHLKQYPLLLYATLFWVEHAKFLPCAAPIFNLSLPIHAADSSMRKAWWGTLCSREYMFFCSKHENALLHQASYLGITPLLARLLLEFKRTRHLERSFHSSDINKKSALGRTALHYAALQGHKAVIALLLKHGAEVRAKDESQKSVLHYAVRGGNEAAVTLLLTVQGIDVTARDIDGKTVLHEAAIWSGGPIMSLLLSTRICDPNVQDWSGWTPLHYAAAGGQISRVNLLLEAEAIDVNIKTGDGDTALALNTMCDQGTQDKIWQLLHRAGATV